MIADESIIVSQDYADLLIEFHGDQNVFNAFPNAAVTVLSPVLAVVHVPVEDITEDTIQQLGYRVMPFIYGLISRASLEASGILRIREVPSFDLRGQGVLIGIIDTGIDYTNPVFQNADGTTRIDYIWDQTVLNGTPPEGIHYGSEFTKEQINRALSDPDPLSIVPSTDKIGHGTMVAGIAGGTDDPDNDFYGVAPDSEFIIVKLKQAKNYLKRFFRIPETAIGFQGNDIIIGVNYLVNTARILNKPIVICLAVGSSQGAHDGRSEIASYLSSVATTFGLCIVIAAGNEGNARRHYYGVVDRTTGYNTVELNVGENESGFWMELWGKSPSIFSIDITSPSGEYVPRIAASMNEHREITFIFEPTVINLDYQMVESQTGDQLILFRFDQPSAGIWRFNVYEKGDLNLGFHIWLPMEAFISPYTYFIRSDPNTTILSAGNSEVPITVTAYNDADSSLYLNASRGYSRIGIIKPEIAAPGVNVTGPNLQHGFTNFTGTSAAAAHTAGAVALILEWGIVRNNLVEINTVAVKKLIERGARRAADLNYPNRDWGYGILDVYKVFDSLRTGLF